MTTSLSWDAYGHLLGESYSGGPLNGLGLSNIYDPAYDRTNLSLNASGTALAAAAYNYLGHEPQVDYINYTQSGTDKMKTQNTWDNLKRLTGIVTTTNSVAMTSYQYAYNTAGQRVSVTNVHGGYWTYQYDSLGQLVSANQHWSNGNLVAGQQFDYNFDSIGNRQSTGQGGDSMGIGMRQSYYSANLLNQYT